MAGVPSISTARLIGTLFGDGSVTGMTDEQLLDRFVSERDATSEYAFAVLVQRHGPMVLGVCRSVARRPARRRGCLPGHVPGAGPPGVVPAGAREPGALAFRGRAADGAEGQGPAVTAGAPDAAGGGHERDRGRIRGTDPGVNRRGRGQGAARGDRPLAGEVPDGGGPLRPRGADP